MTGFLLKILWLLWEILTVTWESHQGIEIQLITISVVLAVGFCKLFQSVYHKSFEYMYHKSFEYISRHIFLTVKNTSQLLITSFCLTVCITALSRTKLLTELKTHIRSCSCQAADRVFYRYAYKHDQRHQFLLAVG